MVQVTNVIVVLVLFIVLLAVGIILLSGIVPDFKAGLNNVTCGLGIC